MVNTCWLEQCVRRQKLLPVEPSHRADFAATEASAQVQHDDLGC